MHTKMGCARWILKIHLLGLRSINLSYTISNYFHVEDQGVHEFNRILDELLLWPSAATQLRSILHVSILIPVDWL